MNTDNHKNNHAQVSEELMTKPNAERITPELRAYMENKLAHKLMQAAMLDLEIQMLQRTLGEQW